MRLLLSSLILGGLLAGQLKATPLTYIGSEGNLSATVQFEAQGSNLIVTLRNTSTVDQNVPSDVLTGVFFTVEYLTPGANLTPVSAVLGPGSQVVSGDCSNGPCATQPAGGVVGGEWAYKSGLAIQNVPGTHGISSSGLGLFGPHDLFPGAVLDPPSPGGLSYGLVSSAWTRTGDNGGLKKARLVQDAVVFTLVGLPEKWESLAQVVNVSLQYGTSLTEPRIPGTPLIPPPPPPPPGGEVPEPSSVALVAAGMVALAVLRTRRRG